jgi:hypothetical protein
MANKRFQVWVNGHADPNRQFHNYERAVGDANALIRKARSSVWIQIRDNEENKFVAESRDGKRIKGKK